MMVFFSTSGAVAIVFVMYHVIRMNSGKRLKWIVIASSIVIGLGVSVGCYAFSIKGSLLATMWVFFTGVLYIALGLLSHSSRYAFAIGNDGIMSRPHK